MEFRDMFFNNLDRLRRKHLRRIDDKQGFFRKAYRIQTNSFGEENRGRVVKVALRKEKVRANSAEFQTWMSVSGTPMEQYFSPIRNRSENFEFIIMDYADPSKATLENAKKLRNKLSDKIDSDDVPLKRQSSLDISPRNTGLHKQKGCVMIDYPWGADWTQKFE
jgi:hypothetical protein